jgi:HEAT repeat protein
LNEDLASSELLPVAIDETKLISEKMAQRAPEADAILALRANLDHVSKGSSDFVRERSVWALSLVRNGRIVEPLIGALRSDDWRERAYAGWALAQVKDQRAIDPLLEAARDAHWRVRMHALFALGETDGRDMERANALIVGLDDTAWQVRYEAAQYLGDVGGPDATGALKRVVADSHLAVREIAVESLAKLRGR